MLTKLLLAVGHWLLARAGEPKAEPVAVAKPDPVAFVCESPDWEPEDRQRWRSFLNSPTGQKLQAKLRHGEYRIAVAAVEADPADAVQACGRASGFRGLAAYLFSLSAPDEPQSTDTAQPDEGEQDLRAHYSP